MKQKELLLPSTESRPEGQDKLSEAYRVKCHRAYLFYHVYHVAFAGRSKQ